MPLFLESSDSVYNEITHHPSTHPNRPPPVHLLPHPFTAILNAIFNVIVNAMFMPLLILEVSYLMSLKCHF